MKKLRKGDISIGRVSCGGQEPDYIHMEIEDNTSRVTFLEIKMDFETFAKVITGQSSLPIEFEVRNLDKIGKRFEHKTEEVPVALTNGFIDDDQIDAAVGYHEMDG